MRAGLAALTALLTAIFVLKGRDNVSDLTEPCRAIAVGLLGLALALLLAATMWISRALAGPPGEEILLAPAQDTATPLVQVTDSVGRQPCGQLIGVSDHELIVRPATGPVLIPLSAVVAVAPVTTCP